jgi:hypothetical protein
MHVNRSFCYLALFASMVPASAALAQNANVTMLRGGTGVEAAGCSETEAKNRRIQPYTGVRKTTSVQKLANGTTIARETVAKEARDSSGRTYHENQSMVYDGSGVQQPGVTFVNVFDPVNRTNVNWSTQTKEATVFHQPDPIEVRNVPPLVPAPAVQPRPSPVANAMTQRTVEQLGEKTINGLEAKGTRTTRTYPVGAVGNDQPIVVTSEFWFATDLGIPVLQIDDDPRTGTRTTELTEIDRGEPDPALFQPPEGYTVKDQYPNRQN